MKASDHEKGEFVGLTLRVKLCGRGLRAEADAARRLRAGACPATARVAEGDAQLELRAACRPPTL